MGVKEQMITSDYAIYNSDCIEVTNDMITEKRQIHFSVYSPPFCGLCH
jgi:hypothetical protein